MDASQTLTAAASAALSDLAEGELRRFEAWKKRRVVTEDRILGGEPTFPESRLAIRHIEAAARASPPIAEDALGDPRAAPPVAEDALGDPRAAPPVAEDALGDPRAAPPVAKDALGDPRAAPPVTEDALGDPRAAPPIAEDALGDPRAAPPVAEDALGDGRACPGAIRQSTGGSTCLITIETPRQAARRSYARRAMISLGLLVVMLMLLPFAIRAATKRRDERRGLRWRGIQWEPPDEADALVTSAVAKQNAGDLPGALAEYDRALARKRTALALNNRGCALLAAGEEARGALSHGDAPLAVDVLLRHERTYPKPMLAEERDALMVQALVRAGRYDEARARANAFRRGHPGACS